MVSSSSSKKRVSNQYNTDNRQFVLDGIDGPATIADAEGDVDITYTDQGAVEAGRDLGLAALDYGAESQREAYDFSRSVQREATESQRQAVNEVAQANRYALEFADDIQRDEGARNVETLIKWGAGAAIAAVTIPALAATLRS